MTRNENPFKHMEKTKNMYKSEACVKPTFVVDARDEEFVENIGNKVHHGNTHWSQLTNQHLADHTQLLLTGYRKSHMRN